jgi:hypothetical protein
VGQFPCYHRRTSRCPPLSHRHFDPRISGSVVRVPRLVQIDLRTLNGTRFSTQCGLPNIHRLATRTPCTDWFGDSRNPMTNRVKTLRSTPFDCSRASSGYWWVIIDPTVGAESVVQPKDVEHFAVVVVSTDADRPAHSVSVARLNHGAHRTSFSLLFDASKAILISSPFATEKVIKAFVPSLACYTRNAWR